MYLHRYYYVLCKLASGLDRSGNTLDKSRLMCDGRAFFLLWQTTVAHAVVLLGAHTFTM